MCLRGWSTSLRGHYPDQVRRSAAVLATLSARLPELPLRCYPVVKRSLRRAPDAVKLPQQTLSSTRSHHGRFSIANDVPMPSANAA